MCIYSYFFFLSSLPLSSKTGAAGMLNHHSLNRRIHLSVCALRGGEYIVNRPTKASNRMYLKGKKNRTNAVTTRLTANFSLAWIINKFM